LKKTAAESHRMILEAYRDTALLETTCRDWFRRLKAGNFDVEDKECPGQPKMFQDTEVNENDPQTLQQLAEQLGVAR